MDPALIIILLLVLTASIIPAIIIPISVLNAKYRDFVLQHSSAIKELNNINGHYKFNIIKNYDMKHSYDNEKYYEMISPKDYLIYQLVDKQDDIIDAMNDAYGNKIMYDKYWEDIKEKCFFNRYDTNDLPKNQKRLSIIEKKCFYNLTKNPQKEFSIHVYLELTDLNKNRTFDAKSNVFYSNQIRSLIKRINNKRNTFYLDQEIWNAICRVERGKVSNKMRFAIYERDGHRCRICGSRLDDLEIDHIIPISKGGKSTMDNLQTLCHRCNVRKGDSV